MDHVADVAALLDSPEIVALIVAVDAAGSPRGRKGYGARALLGACLVKSLFALPTWTFVAALLAEHPGLQEALGGCPSVWATPTHRGATAAQSALAKVAASDKYKIDRAVCTRTGLPLAWQTRTARHHESLFVATLLDAVRARGFQPETVAMDKGYDIERVHAECEARGCNPVIPMKGTKGKQIVLPITTGGRLFPHIARHTERFRTLYRGRAAVEREFGRLKHEYGLGPLRVRGLDRVQLHADLTILSRLKSGARAAATCSRFRP